MTKARKSLAAAFVAATLWTFPALAEAGDRDERFIHVRPAVIERDVEQNPSRRRPTRGTSERGVGWRAAYPHVSTSCFPAELRAKLTALSRQFGRPVLITSGFRRGRGGSYHHRCMAADIRMPGIHPRTLYNTARGMFAGAGYYGPRGHVHVDVRPRQYAYNW